MDPLVLGLDVAHLVAVLSRYPIHRLSKRGEISIQIRKSDDRGELIFKWEVSGNNKLGDPGPLAYKLDTLIINRRIDAAGKPVPKIIRLGSLNEISHELGRGETRDTVAIRKALLQNASAFITAKLSYKGSDGAKREFKFGDTRYGVVFAGEKLPDGRGADSVYIVLYDLYRDLLSHAPTRPLDYDYLKDLPPTAQRFYELLSFQMFAALKNARPRAKYLYSEFCTLAPQTRYYKFDEVKKQMHKVHASHRKAGYIEKTEYHAVTDSEGKPDWEMLYTPGPKAKAEYKAFQSRLPSAALSPAPERQPQRRKKVNAAPSPLGPEEEVLVQKLSSTLSICTEAHRLRLTIQGLSEYLTVKFLADFCNVALYGRHSKIQACVFNCL